MWRRWPPRPRRGGWTSKLCAVNVSEVSLLTRTLLALLLIVGVAIVPLWGSGGAYVGRSVLQHVSLSLSSPGPRDVPWWQWGALVLLLPAAWAAGLVIARVAANRISRIAAKTSATWDDVIAERTRGPLRLAASLLVVWAAVPWLGLNSAASVLVTRGIRAGALSVLFWGALRAIGASGEIVARSTWGRAHPAARSLLPVALRTARVAIFAAAVIAVLTEFGYPVTSLLVGLGVGGLALALAAQKTVENLFGALAIGTDEPFREGDFVRVEDFVGTVECIGLRSTRIRTLDRTIITIPNGRLADMRTESFAARDRIRLACTIGLVYGTSGRQMRNVLEGLERVLRSHPKIWSEVVVVRFKEFGASSLDVEVMAWFMTSDWGEFQRIRQDVLLAFMNIVEEAGSSFAFPTRTVHLVAVPPDAPRNELADPSALLRARMHAVDAE